MIVLLVLPLSLSINLNQINHDAVGMEFHGLSPCVHHLVPFLLPELTVILAR